MGRLGSRTLFSCPGAWPLQCGNELGFFSPRYARAGSGDSCGPRKAGAPGQCFHICLFISRKVIMDFISLTHRFVNKMPNSVRSYPNKPPFVLVASLNSEILPFLETVPLLHISTSVALPACRPLTSVLRRIPLSKLAAPQGLSALAWHPMVCPVRGLAFREQGRGWSLLQAWAACPPSRLAVPRAGFEHAGGQPWLLHNQTAGSSGEGESCRAATTDPSLLRNSQALGSSKCAGFPPAPCQRQRIGFLRCCDPVLLPLIKMLSDTGLVLWVSSLLGVGRARGLCSWRWGRGGQDLGSSACSSLPCSAFPEEAHTGVWSFHEGSRKG